MHLPGCNMHAAQRIYQRCDALAALSAIPDGLTRIYLSAEHRRANALVGTWMREAGMTVWQDAVGNICGRYEGQQLAAPAWLLGSHLDTVRHAGRYDGMLGVVTAIELVAECNREGRRFPFAIEVIGFGDEEGVRFGTTLLGSHGIAAGWSPDWLQQTDADGITLAQALQDFGLDPVQIAQARRQPDEFLGYLELHIEQGPQLEAAGLALGVVSAINGAKRLNVVFTGEAGHAGTVPMGLRQDALAGTSEFVLAVESVACLHGIVATVGKISCQPDAVNVIPAQVSVSLDIRADSDSCRERALADILARAADIARRRHLQYQSSCFYESKATPCAERLQRALAAAVEQVQSRSLLLPSGAGHDAVAVSTLCDVGMLFVRCAGGISHHPAEAVMVEDIALALRTLALTMRSL